MINTILCWIGTLLGWIDGWAGSYLLALLIFAVLVELIMLPLGIKQQKNSIRQARLRPKEMAIRNKYKGRNDKVTQQKVTEEIQALYQQEKFSPFSGCLPMLIQLPVILALYQVVIKPLEYVVQMSSTTIDALTKFLGEGTATGDAAYAITQYYPTATGGSIGLISTINKLDLSFFSQNGLDAAAYAELSQVFDSLPNFNVFGLNLGMTPSITSPSLLLIVPVLTFVIYFLSMKLTRKFSFQPNAAASDQQAACSNKVMDIMMPAFSFFISFNVPAAIGIYWSMKSVLGTLKQFILMKAMPLPVCTEADIKAAEKELKNKKPPVREITDEAVKSLAAYDDDDEPYPTFVGQKSYYDELEDKKKKAGESAMSDETSKTEEENDSSEKPADAPKSLESAPVKDDDRQHNEHNGVNGEEKNKDKKKRK